MIAQSTSVLVGSVCGFGGAGLAIASRYFPRPRRTTAPAGPVATGFRYCPTEHRTRAAVLHPDGTATCADPACGTHIPAGDS